MSYKSAASSCKVPVPHQDKHLPPDFFEVLLILVPAVPHPEANFLFLHSEAGSYLTGNAALSRPVPDFFPGLPPVSLCFLARRRPETGDRFEKENGSRVTLAYLS